MAWTQRRARRTRPEGLGNRILAVFDPNDRSEWLPSRRCVVVTDAHDASGAGVGDESAWASQLLVASLRAVLGAKLLAYIGGVESTSVVREWADGATQIDPLVVERFRLTYRLARVLTERDTAAVAQTWFLGRNPELDDQPPAWLLRHGDITDIAPKLLAAANSHAH